MEEEFVFKIEDILKVGRVIRVYSTIGKNSGIINSGDREG